MKVPSALHSLTSTLLTDRRTTTLQSWFQSPIKNIFRVFWKRYRYKIIVVSIILMMGLILFNFIYSAPVSVGTGTKALVDL